MAARAASTAVDPCATALFCDDFESYTAGQAPGGNWTPVGERGRRSRSTPAQFRSGIEVGQVHDPGRDGSKTAYIRLASTATKTIFPAPGNMFYGRMMFRLEAAPTGDVHWTIIEGSGLVPGQSYHALYRYGGQHPVMNGDDVRRQPADGQLRDARFVLGQRARRATAGSTPTRWSIPAATWSCVEWQFDGPNNTMRLWLDGAAVDSLTVTGIGQGCGNQPATYAWTAPTFDRLDLGWESYQQDDARTI